jgi:predicted branched-subunit amino acid permease
MTSRERAVFTEGARASAALLVGMIPWGFVSGAAMVAAGLSPGQAVSMSVFVFAGSAQLAVLPLLVAKAPLWVMILTGLVVNLRYVIYSAVLAPHFGHLSRWWRALLAYLIVDGMFATFAARYHARSDDRDKHWFFLGGSVVVWLVWQAAAMVGIFGGTLIPPSWSLEFAATLSLIALTMPLLYDRAVILGAIVAGVVALVARGLPMNLGLVTAVTVGVAVGMVLRPWLVDAREAGRV